MCWWSSKRCCDVPSVYFGEDLSCWGVFHRVGTIVVRLEIATVAFVSGIVIEECASAAPAERGNYVH
jgi:hypothetical protein